MQKQKKQWTRPQLIVLDRGRPEENVLATCKNRTSDNIGPGLGGACVEVAGRPCNLEGQS
jgi:hypothetical protein